MSNQIPSPTLRQLDRPINTPNIDADHGQNHCGKHPGQGTASDRSEEPHLRDAAQKVRRAQNKHRDAEQLEHDAGDHGAGAGVCVAARRVGGGGGQATAGGLHD